MRRAQRRRPARAQIVEIGLAGLDAMVKIGLAGIGLAWAIYGRQRVAVPRQKFLQRLLEHKFYFDELYDAAFYKPGVAIANGLRREFEEPVVLQTGRDIGEAALDTGDHVRRFQTGLLRTYVLFLGTGLAVVGVVFLIVK